MIADLATASEDQFVTADVAVAGAGLAGLIMACELAMRGYRVVVAESGGTSQQEDQHPLNDVVLAAHPYRGAADGRFRCLGGTSTRWGGALLPYIAEDLGSHTANWSNGWFIGFEDIFQYTSKVEQLFGLTNGPYDGEISELAPSPPLLDGFVPRAAKWPTFEKRNVANIFASRLLHDRNLSIWHDATITRLNFSDGHYRGFDARSINKRRLVVDAPITLLACGAIENTRLLLVHQRVEGSPNYTSAIGRYFHDHLSAPVADLEPLDRERLAHLYSFRFVKGGMRNWRQELSGTARKTRGMPAAFAHVTFEAPEGGGFSALRDVLQSVQKAQMPSVSVLVPMVKALPWLVSAVYWRGLKRAVLPPNDARFRLHLVTEQLPRARNRITLCDSKRDPFGVPLASIDWEVGENDVRTFKLIRNHLVETWRESGNRSLAVAQERSDDDIVLDLIHGGGIYHPAGSTRIGSDPDTSVLDANLSPHGTDGLLAISTAAFPHIGGANPSLTLLCLALRAVDEVDRRLRSVQ